MATEQKPIEGISVEIDQRSESPRLVINGAEIDPRAVLANDTILQTMPDDNGSIHVDLRLRFVVGRLDWWGLNGAHMTRASINDPVIVTQGKDA